ncbi:MAG: xanthine phosphoribosyltransferase [Clostridiales bacterium]|nr:xanthine phosphoribosyltransferase [Clostridiales bacterium]
MQELREAIKKYGEGIGTDIVKVSSFLNHGLNTALLFKMGEKIAQHFAGDKPELILTVEASGIALAMTTAHALGNLPVVFCKKTPAKNLNEASYTAVCTSFTRGTSYVMRCDKALLAPGTRVLIVDDFLANGEAVRGLMDIVRKAGATTIGVAIAIEKGFQPGGKQLREQGVPLLSLSIVREIRNGHIILADD